MMNFRKEVLGRLPAKVVLAADVGGTFTRVGLCSVVGKKVRLCCRYVFPTSEIKSFNDVIKTVLSDSGTKPWRSCIAGAGPVSPDGNRLKLTNAKISIDRKRLPVKSILLNDFVALGYAINVLTPKDIRKVRTVKTSPNLPMALIGAGTGLGKAILIYDQKSKIYVPMCSEGGHADLPVKSSDEFILSKGDFEWEDVLSGSGIVAIYEFLRTIHPAPNLSDPGIIMTQNTVCARRTKSMLSSFFARCARNFALDTLASGGVYIGGGIAAKNEGLFGSAFVKEFLENKHMGSLLKTIPLTIITNEDVPLYGAAFAGVQ